MVVGLFGRGFLLVGLSGWAIVPAMAEAPVNANVNVEAQCSAQVISFGATRSERDRVEYLCEGAIDVAPAQCYWNALSFGANDEKKNRAARLCRGATSAAPAQCYWESLSFGATRSMQRRAVRNCRTRSIIIILPSYRSDPALP